MNHLSDDDLVLHYYGEDAPETVVVERHLRSCAQCAQAYEALTRTLQAVTAPGFVDGPGDTFALRELLCAQVRRFDPPAAASLPWWRSEPGAVALAWLVPVAYPWSLPALFRSVQWAHQEFAGIAVTVVMLLWACAGPLAAALVLHRFGDRVNRVSTRLRVVGAVMAAISPPLFMLIARGGQHVPSWYVALGAAALLALVPWPDLSGPTVRLRSVHRLSAALLGIFILGHIVNQSLAFFSVPSYAAMRSVMQGASQQSISYAVIVTAAAIQILTGTAMSLRKVRGGAFATNLQTVSGWYLAVFLLSHVFAGFLLSRPAGVAPVAASLTPPYVLANARAVAQLPYYLLGVAAFLVHVGVFARLTALAYLAESSVRRLSYAAAFAGATVVVAVGLSLCGIHVLP
jgi:succinate dehydrogenase/fumarate reductase cytochrome b subunit